MATQCMLRLTLACAQVKAAVAHVRTLKRNQRKRKLSLTYLVILRLNLAQNRELGMKKNKAGKGLAGRRRCILWLLDYAPAPVLRAPMGSTS